MNLIDEEDQAALYVPSPNLKFLDYEPNNVEGSKWLPGVCCRPSIVPSNDQQFSINCSGDSADVPLLLNNIDDFGGIVYENSDHCHAFNGTQYSNSKAWKRLMWAAILCFIFMLTELIGGILAGSLAVMTDAAHLLSDFVGFLVSLFALWVAAQPPTKRFSFGYYRAEVLGALFSIAVIWLLTGIFVYLAILRLIKSDYDIHADAMLIVAVFGIAVNIGMGLVLHGTCSNDNHTHSHGLGQMHSHNKDPMNINIRAAIIHVLGDLLQSVGVFVSACIIKFYPNAKVADPICTFIFSLLVMVTTFRVFMDSLWVLLETVPSHISHTELVSALSSIEGVRAIHDLHVWSLTPGQYAFSVHLAVDSTAISDVVLENSRNILKSKFGISRTTIQIERFLPDVIQNCQMCQLPKD